MASLIIYGDSFSTPSCCASTPEQMWFRHAWPNDTVIVNRARALNGPQAMFLEATHDAIARSEPTRLVIALGPLSRLPQYLDGWYDKEQLTDHRPEDGRVATLADASARLRSFTWQDMQSGVDSGLIDFFHPTLLWSMLFKDVTRPSRSFNWCGRFCGGAWLRGWRYPGAAPAPDPIRNYDRALAR